MKSNVFAEPVLIGREHELKELNLFLKSAINGKGKTVFISGEAGSGKTKLINYFLNKTQKLEVNILTGWCLSNATIPFFPFYEAFNAYFKEQKAQKDSVIYSDTKSRESIEKEKLTQEELELKNWLIGTPQLEKPSEIQLLSTQMRKDQTFTVVTKIIASISKKNLQSFSLTICIGQILLH
ncbi:MAG: AAA family ATPase [Promethearchaeota archaeon]|jgi:predicted ATPase